MRKISEHLRGRKWLFGTINSQNRIRSAPLPMIDHVDGGGDHFGGERRLSWFGEARVAMVSPLGRSRCRGAAAGLEEEEAEQKLETEETKLLESVAGG